MAQKLAAIEPKRYQGPNIAEITVAQIAETRNNFYFKGQLNRLLMYGIIVMLNRQVTEDEICGLVIALKLS